MSTARMVDTRRLRVHAYFSGPEDGIPVLLIHGNLATGRFFQHLMPRAPANLRLIAPDMRGFGRTEPLTIDATRGLRDWAGDAAALLDALGIARPVHLVGWSTGGAAAATFALADPHRVASLTLLAPVSPYGFGGTSDAHGTPCHPDFAGSGAGRINDEFLARLAARDRSADSPFSVRNVINALYWAPSHREPPAYEDILVDEILLTRIGEGAYPGDSQPSPNWPGRRPGVNGILNALSPKYCNWSGLVGIEPKPPILWTHGSADAIVCDHSTWDTGTLGQAGVLPGWPGQHVYPPQPMLTQIRTVLAGYRERGGSVRAEWFEGSGHGPHFDAVDRWSQVFFDFVREVEG